MKVALGVLAAALVLAAPAAATTENPCTGPEARHLLCPNLRIGTPSEMYVSEYEGRTLLHATSDVESRGRGPIEVRGRRDGPKSMRVTQRIYKVGGGHVTLHTNASLHFTDVGEYFGGAYWKVHQLARFELRKVRPDGTRGPVLRTSPKLNYCLRDLERTRPGRRSPTRAVYPGCNQDPSIRRDVLGTSVGWSDIYPADYDKQYIDVTGLHGCFVFSMTVDPKHLLFESNERDNSSHRRVRLPFTGAGC
ncbi:MAG TPA: lysyl oxidase family protein [Solirubrobacterales bacterium]|nr:lysyl oxidase family protein [Solirubrobacterales bacterium]